MAGKDDLAGSLDVAPAALANAMHRCLRDPGAFGEREFRFAGGRQVFGESHGITVNRNRSTVNAFFGYKPKLPDFGYLPAMTIKDAFEEAFSAAI